MNTTNLSDQTCTDELLGDLIDEDPRLGALWLLILAASQPWGRFPANIKLFKARVCPMVDSFSGDALQALVDRLVDAGMMAKYTCPWSQTACLAVVHHARYNGDGRRFNRLGKPEYGPHPGWQPPHQLVSYLQAVSAGKFVDKKTGKALREFGAECEKFGVDPALLDMSGTTPAPIPDYSRTAPGQARDMSGTHPPRARACSRLQTEDGGLRTEECNDSVRQDDQRAPAGSAGAAPCGGLSENEPRIPADGTARASPVAGVQSDGTPDCERKSVLLPEQIWLLARIEPVSNEPEERKRLAEAKRAFLRGEEGPVNGYEFPARDRVPDKARELADRGAPAASVPGG